MFVVLLSKEQVAGTFMMIKVNEKKIAWSGQHINTERELIVKLLKRQEKV